MYTYLCCYHWIYWQPLPNSATYAQTKQIATCILYQYRWSCRTILNKVQAGRSWEDGQPQQCLSCSKFGICTWSYPRFHGQISEGRTIPPQITCPKNNKYPCTTAKTLTLMQSWPVNNCSYTIGVAGVRRLGGRRKFSWYTWVHFKNYFGALLVCIMVSWKDMEKSDTKWVPWKTWYENDVRERSERNIFGIS